MQTDKVSVVIPVYNGMPNIKMSIASLMLQTYTNWEAIIIDDGSTDGTSEYIDSLNDDRIIIYHFRQNMGRPYARQKALELATGKYLAMLDADDFYAPTKLERQVEIMRRYPDVALVSCGLCSWGKLTTELRVRGCGDNMVHEATQQTTVPHACSMLRMELAKQYSYNLNLKYGQDQDFLHRYLDGKSYYAMNQVMYYYSEFDSVNRAKIINTHLVCLMNAFKTNQYHKCVVEGLKYALCSLIYPMLKDEQILLRRGSVPTQNQYTDFYTIFNELKSKLQ